MGGGETLCREKNLNSFSPPFPSMPRTSPTRKRGGSGTATSSSPSSSPKRAEITLVDSDQDQDEKESPPRDAEEEVVLVDAPCVKCGRSDEALPVSCGHALHSACYAKVSCFGGGRGGPVEQNTSESSVASTSLGI